MKIHKSICAKCTHCVSKGEIWYDWFCHVVERERAQDPVMGDKCFSNKNSLGGKYYTDVRFPNCREINPDGNCELFTKKSWLKS